MFRMCLMVDKSYICGWTPISCRGLYRWRMTQEPYAVYALPWVINLPALLHSWRNLLTGVFYSIPIQVTCIPWMWSLHVRCEAAKMSYLFEVLTFNNLVMLKSSTKFSHSPLFVSFWRSWFPRRRVLNKIYDVCGKEAGEGRLRSVISMDPANFLSSKNSRNLVFLILFGQRIWQNMRTRPCVWSECKD